MKSYILFFSVLILLFSCKEEELIIDDYEGESKPVLSGFLSPDKDAPGVRIDVAHPFLGDFPSELQNPELFEVWLKNQDNDSVQLIYEMGFQEFLGPNTFKIKEGENYSIRVKTPWGAEAFSNAIIPDSFDAQTVVKIDSLVTDSNWVKYTVEVEITDNAGAQNYYAVSGNFTWSYSEGIADPIITFGTMDLEPGTEILLSDDGIQGKKIVYRFYKWLNKKNDQPLIASVKIKNVNKDYYLYHKSLIEAGVNIFGSGLGIPVSDVYTNIIGGFGVFCGSILISDTQYFYQ